MKASGDLQWMDIYELRNRFCEKIRYASSPTTEEFDGLFISEILLKLSQKEQQLLEAQQKDDVLQKERAFLEKSKSKIKAHKAFIEGSLKVTIGIHLKSGSLMARGRLSPDVNLEIIPAAKWEWLVLDWTSARAKYDNMEFRELEFMLTHEIDKKNPILGDFVRVNRESKLGREFIENEAKCKSKAAQSRRGRPPVADWAALQDKLSREIEKRGWPDLTNDEDWSKQADVERFYCELLENKKNLMKKDSKTPSFSTVRKQVVKALRQLWGKIPTDN